MPHPALRTPLCDLLGIEFPIIQAGMGFVAGGALAAAVSEAGGLGVIGAATMSPGDLRREIKVVRERTRKPFGVDILFTPGSGRSQEAASPLAASVRELVDVVFEAEVPVLASGLGNPGPVVAQAHNLGIVVLALVGNTKNAVRVADSGVDCVVAQGYDGGGHTGRVGTMTIVPAVLDAVEVPVVAAGGIADGRGLAAVLGMGACGVWMGTRFVASVEAHGHDNYKQRIVEIDDEGTIRTRCFSGKPCRMIRNRITEAWESPELQRKIQPFPRQWGVMNEWLGHDPYTAGRYEGRIEDGALAAGQSAALIDEVLPVAEIVRQVMDEADSALSRLTACA